MFSALKRPTILAIPIIHGWSSSFDEPVKPLPRETPNDGWGRVKAIFQTTEYQAITPELASCIQTTVFGFFFGSFYGGVLSSRSAYQNFMDSNMATKFLTQMDAKKRIQDAVTLGFIRGAVRWGSRIGYFTGMYITLTTIISNYRGKSSLFEYSAAGFIAGSIYKIAIGIRGMIAGGIIGCFLASICGVLTLGLLQLSGNTVQSHQAWLHDMHQSRKEQEVSSISALMAKEEKNLMSEENEPGAEIHQAYRKRNDERQTIDELLEKEKKAT